MHRELSSTFAYYFQIVKVTIFFFVAMLMLTSASKPEFFLFALIIVGFEIYFIYSLFFLRIISFDGQFVYASSIFKKDIFPIGDIKSLEARGFRSKLSFGSYWAYDLQYLTSNQRVKKIHFDLDYAKLQNMKQFILLLPFQFDGANQFL